MSNKSKSLSQEGQVEGQAGSKPQQMRWWVLFGLWLLYVSFGLLAVSIAPMVGLIQEDLSLSHASMGSVMGAWQFVYIFSAIPCGVLLDKLGGRRALIIGILLVALSGLSRAAAVDYWTFLLAVMVFGLGGPIISSGAPKVVAELFSGSDRGLAMGIYMTGPGIGGVICLTLTHAVLLPMFDMQWRGVMALWTGVALVCMLVWVVIGYIAQLDQVKPADANLSTSENLFVSQWHQMSELLSQRSVQLVLCMSVGVFMFNHGLNNWLPEMLMAGGIQAVHAGFWAALPTVVGILGSLLIPRLATPQRRFKILALLCVAAFVATLCLHATDGISLSTGLILQGIARSSMMTVLILTLVELPGIGDKKAGIASGMFFSAAEIGGVLGPFGMGVVFDLTGGFAWALIFLSGVAFLLFLGSLGLGKLSTSANPRQTPDTTL